MPGCRYQVWLCGQRQAVSSSDDLIHQWRQPCMLGYLSFTDTIMPSDSMNMPLVLHVERIQDPGVNDVRRTQYGIFV